MINWIKDRFAERSSWGGGAIIVVSAATLIASPLIKYIAIAGVVYGIYAIITKG